MRAWNATGEGKQIARAATADRPQGGAAPEAAAAGDLQRRQDGAHLEPGNRGRAEDAERPHRLRLRGGHQPGRELVASGGYGGEVKVWKVADGTNVKSFNAAPGLPLPEPVKPK